MTWIDRRMADLESWKKRNATIRDHALEVYEGLWDEIVEHVNEAKEKGFRVSTNGAPRKRVISLEKQNKSGQHFELQVMLIDTKDRIRVTGEHLYRIELSLDLDICPDGVVCLKLAGKRISIEDAAISILDPFLFPQLQGPM
jgi:hypothetical protein